MTKSPGINVLVVDDHELVRQGIAKLLQRVDGLTLAAEAHDVKSAKAALRKARPELAIIDLSLQQGDGFELIRYIAQHYGNVRIIVSSMHEDALFIERALRAGAHAYVTKSSPGTMLLDAIQEVLQGRRFVPPDVSERVLRRLENKPLSEVSVANLTDREQAVFDLIGEGLPIRQIAERLHRSPKTIESHVERIKQKLDVETASELHRLAFTHKAGLRIS